MQQNLGSSDWAGDSTLVLVYIEFGAIALHRPVGAKGPAAKIKNALFDNVHFRFFFIRASITGSKYRTLKQQK